MALHLFFEKSSIFTEIFEPLKFAHFRYLEKLALALKLKLKLSLANRPKYSQKQTLLAPNLTIIKFLFHITGFRRQRATLHWVKIYFPTPTFEQIKNDAKANLETKLSAVGGTMGLLTGFSIISGVEIMYFATKIFFGIVQKKIRKKGGKIRNA